MKLYRKGVGEILSWTLVIMIVIGLSVIASTFLIDQTKEIGEDSGDNLRYEVACESINLKVKKVIENDGSNDYLSILTVKNDGLKSISKIQVILMCGDIKEHDAITKFYNLSLEPGETNSSFIDSLSCTSTDPNIKRILVTPFIDNVHACVKNSYEYIDR